jgi:hypothetical protein
MNIAHALLFDTGVEIMQQVSALISLAHVMLDACLIRHVFYIGQTDQHRSLQHIPSSP